jgi:hypothetical protein
MEPSFISEKCEFWINNTTSLQKSVTNMRSSLVIAFFSYYNLSSTALCLVLNALFSRI